MVMQPDGGHALVHAPTRTEMARAQRRISPALGRRSGAWTLPCTPGSARDLRRPAAYVGSVEVDTPSRRWLEEAPRWIARRRWSPPPRERCWLLREVGRAAGRARRVRGTNGPWDSPSRADHPRQRRGLARSHRGEREPTFASAVAAANGWNEGNPDAHDIPGAILDLVDDETGPHLHHRGDLGRGGGGRFRAARGNHPPGSSAHELPAAAWPTDILARFMRNRGSSRPRRRRRGPVAAPADRDALGRLELSYGEGRRARVEGLAAS